MQLCFSDDAGAGRPIVEVQMKKLLLSAAAIAMLGVAPASAADAVLGRISYISPDGHHLILDGQRDYMLAPSARSGNIGVAEFVRLSLGPDGAVSSISPGPPALAGYWAPAP